MKKRTGLYLICLFNLMVISGCNSSSPSTAASSISSSAEVTNAVLLGAFTNQIGTNGSTVITNCLSDNPATYFSNFIISGTVSIICRVTVVSNEEINGTVLYPLTNQHFYTNIMNASTNFLPPVIHVQPQYFTNLIYFTSNLTATAIFMGNGTNYIASNYNISNLVNSVTNFMTNGVILYKTTNFSQASLASSFSTTNLSITVYTSGCDSANAPCFWTGTTETELTNGSGGLANSIYVYNGTVYTGGWDSTIFSACYWTGTNETSLGLSNDVKSVYVYNGTVYSSGDDPYACYWKGTAVTRLSSNAGTAFSIYVDNGTVYTAGIDTLFGGSGCYWTGTAETPLAAYPCAANSVYVTNGMVYTAGQDSNYKECYWIGTNETLLGGNGASWETCICVNNGTIYNTGRDSNSYFCYWAGTAETWLTNAGNVSSIFVYNGTVYTAGQDFSGDACYWTGSNETILANGGKACSIFVIP